MNRYDPELEAPDYAKIVRERAAERKEKHKADVIARTIDMYATIRHDIQERQLCTHNEDLGTICALLTVAANLSQVSDDLTEIVGGIANIDP